MCQLTLIEFKDQRLAKLIIRPLTEINTVGISTFANNDGFGYVCFSNLDNIIKTKESAQNWWTDNKTIKIKKLKKKKKELQPQKNENNTDSKNFLNTLELFVKKTPPLTKEH